MLCCPFFRPNGADRRNFPERPSHPTVGFKKMEVRTFHRTTFKIPRKERRPSEDCQYTLPVDCREAKDIEHAVKRQTWDIHDLDRSVSILQIKKVDNPNLEREYHEKKAQLRDEGRSPKELTEQLAFRVETENSRVKEICRTGLECNGLDHTLGDGSMGVTVWRSPDLCLRALMWPSSGSAYLVVFKIVKGRVTSVTPRLSSETPYLEPTPNHDCHISRNTASSSVTDLATLLRGTQYYLYEYNDEGLPSTRPRHCLPFAVIPLKRNENSRPRSPKRPMLSIEKPVSPGKEYAKHTEKLKMSSFSDEAGILAWRGLVTSGDKSLGWVSLLAGHKLGFNFWKSYLDVSRKIPLRQLSRMLPGDVRSAWNSPLIYRNHTLSLCTMKVAQGQPSETFTSFSRSLITKAKSAGVLCIDSITTMFLVPSCKLAIHLGLCESEVPPRMFCIICRRQSTPLSPSSVWPLASPVTPPASSCTAFHPNTSIPVEKEQAVLKLFSLDLKARYTAKIVVSSTEKSPRLSPKRTKPRQVVKRSFSFSYSPAKDATKALQRISRSASSTERLSLREDILPKPAIQSEVSCDSSMHRSSSVADNSHVTEYGSCKSSNSVVFSLLCSPDSTADVDKTEDEDIFCNKSENDCDKTTTDLEKGVKSPPRFLASLAPELADVYLAHSATLKTCSNVSKKAKNSHSDPELKPLTGRKPLMEQTDFNASSIVLSSPSSSIREPRETFMTVGESPETPSFVEDAIRKSPCRRDGSSSSTTVKEYEAPLALECARMTLREPTVTPSIVQRSEQNNSRTVNFCVSETSTSSGRNTRESQSSNSPAHASLQCSFVETKICTGEKSIVVREASTSSSPKRGECYVSQSSTSPAQASVKPSLVATSESQEAQSTVEQSPVGLCGVSPMSFWPDSPVVLFSHSARTPENSPVKEVASRAENTLPESSDYSQSYDQFSARVPVNKTMSSEASNDKVKTSNSASLPFEESKLHSSYLGKDILNSAIIPKEVLRFRKNSELHDNVQSVGMEISESSNMDKTNLNKMDDLNSLKNTASPADTTQLCSNWDLHDNLQIMDMEILESSNMDKSDLTKEVTSDVYKNAAPPTEILQLHTKGDSQDNLQIVDMEISESLPSAIVLSQAYPYAPPAPNYDYSWSHFDNVKEKMGSVTSYAGENGVRASLQKHERKEEIFASSFVQQPSVTTTSESSPLAFSIPQSTRNITAENSTTKTVNQTAIIAKMSPVHAEDVVTKSLVDSTTTHACIDIKSVESHDIVKVIDMDVVDDSETLFNNVVCEIDPGQCTPVGHTELLHSANTENTSFTDMTGALASDPQDSKPNMSQGASPCERSTACTIEETVDEVTGSDLTLDCSKGKSSSSKQPYSCTSSCREQETATGATKLQHAVSSTLSVDIQTQSTCSSEENESSLPCGAHTYGKVVGFTLSPRTSRKLSMRRLKTLQDAFKTATNLNESDADINSERSFTSKPFRDTSSPRKLVVSPFKRRHQEPDAAILGSSDCKGMKNSDGSTPKDESEFPKPLTVSSSAVEQPVNCLPEQTVPCPGGVIEMSLLEDWGLQPSPTNHDKGPLREKAFCRLDMEQSDDLDTTEAYNAFECDAPESEIVVCSPSAPVKTFAFRFPGESGLGEDVTGISEARTTKEETETCLVEERFEGVIPQLVPCSGMDSETIVLPSEELVNACLNIEPSWRDELDIGESQVIDCDEVEVEDVIFAPHLSQESAENGCELPETLASGIEEVEVLESSGLIEDSSVQPQNCKEECVGQLSERLEAHCVAATNEKPVIEPENTEAVQKLESEKRQYVSVDLNGGKWFTEITALDGSFTPLENVSKLLMDPCDDTNSNIETTEGLSTVKGNENPPGNEKEERVPSPEVQVMEKGTGNATEESVSLTGLLGERDAGDGAGRGTGNAEKGTGNATEERVSLTGLLGERDAGDGAGREKPLNCLLELPCSSEGKKKELRHEKATAKESVTMHFSSLSQCSMDVETKLTHPGNLKEKVEGDKCLGKPPRASERKESEIGYEKETEEKMETTECPDISSSEEKGMEIRSEKRTEATDCSGNAAGASANATEASVNATGASANATAANATGASPNATDASANAIAKSLALSVARNNNKNAGFKSETSTVTAHLSETPKELRAEISKNSRPAKKNIKAINDISLKESNEDKPSVLTSRYSVSLTAGHNNTTLKSSSKNFSSTAQVSKELSVKNVLAENTAKTVELKKAAEVTNAYCSGTVSAVKSTVALKNTKPGIRRPLSASSRAPCSAGVLYKDPRGKSEPLRDIHDLQRDNRIENMKRKRTTEHEWWGKPPKLIPIPNQEMKNGRKLQKLSPPLPLVSLNTGLTRGQETREVSRKTSCELNIRDHPSYQPYPERDQFDYLSPQMDYYNRESKRVTVIHEQQTHSCWVSRQPTPVPVNNRETGIMQHVVPEEPQWYSQRGISPRDPRINHNQFQQVYPSFPDYGRPAFVPSSCRGHPVLSAPPDLVPGSRLPPSNYCYVPYPLVRPR